VAFGAIFGPLLRTDALPTAAPAARAFFVAPPMLPAPPPPPPAPAEAAAGRPRIPRPALRPAEPARLVAAVEAPSTVLPEATDLDVRAAELGTQTAAEPGGVAGGVPGGVVGGVIGGIPAAPAPIEPIRVGGGIKEPAKLKHVSPVYPDIAVRANVHGNVILECIVSPLGRVTSVTIVKGIPLLDKAAIEAVRQWVYTPTLKDGIPVPVILTITVQFGLKSAGAAVGPVQPAA
jgi:periplasmic protein TonB